MIISQERAFLKAQAQLQEICRFVEQAGEGGVRIDKVERSLFQQLLAVGRTLLEAFVAAQGDGDAGPELTDGDRVLRRLEEARKRRYLSVFGELMIERWVYAVREGQKVERAPLDERLGLPASEFSYVLQDWPQRDLDQSTLQDVDDELRLREPPAGHRGPERHPQLRGL